jgi:hypothetical protein
MVFLRKLERIVAGIGIVGVYSVCLQDIIFWDRSQHSAAGIGGVEGLQGQLGLIVIGR